MNVDKVHTDIEPPSEIMDKQSGTLLVPGLFCVPMKGERERVMYGMNFEIIHIR